MNKTQIILSAIGGVTLVGALVLGYLIWDAFDAKTQSEDQLESGISRARNVMRQLPVKPETSELKVYEESASTYDGWRTTAAAFAARGDEALADTTPAEFKTRLLAKAHELAALPGCQEGGHFVKAGFGFGFSDYVTGGKVPPEDKAGLNRLQREWLDVSHVLETMAAQGGADIGVIAVTLGRPKAPEVTEEAKPKGKAKGKAKAKAKVRKTDEDETEGPGLTAFTVEFQARPSALVKVLNACAKDTRFVVVDSCSFVRETDDLATLDEAKGREASSSRATRRRGRAAAEAETTGGLRVVTDPQTVMLKVTMAVSVYDFGSQMKAKEAVK